MRYGIRCAVTASLLFALGPMALAEQPSGPDQAKTPDRSFVFLGPCPQWKLAIAAPGHEDKVAEGLLLRELVRQALLIAARDELQLTTRDSWLGDPKPDTNKYVVLNIAAMTGKRPGIFIMSMPRKSKPNIAGIDFKFDLDYEHVVVQMEKESRNSFVNVLKHYGFSGQRNKRNADATVDDGTAGLLNEMTFTSQFLAIRQLHETIRQKGESEALLGALVRGYANLGWLTENQWLPAHKVFKARAMLYAQRMLAGEGNNPAWARWHRAYAFAAAGLHAKALDDIKAADDVAQRKPSEAPDDGRPPWVEIIDAHCRYDLHGLDCEKVDKSQRQLTQLLRLIAVELAVGKGARVQVVETAMATLKAMPECYRAHDLLARYSGVGLGHRSTVAGLTTMGQNLYSRLALIPNLPPKARKIVHSGVTSTGMLGRLFGNRPQDPEDEFERRGKLIATLMGLKSATSDEPAEGDVQAEKHIDRGEPSWATLGYLIREISFMQTWRRAYFERLAIGVSTKAFLQTTAPLVADHPYRAFVEAFTNNRFETAEALARLSKMSTDGLDLNAIRFLSSIQKLGFDPRRCQQMLERFSAKSDEVASDLTVRVVKATTKARLSMVQRLFRASPYSPIARFYLISLDYENVEDQVDQWVKEAMGQHVVVLVAFGVHCYHHNKQYEDAERYIKAATEVSPDKDLYVNLAKVYWGQGKTDQWLATLEAFLKQPDYGLSHATIRNEIAKYFMSRREWEKAMPYAEGAAQSYAQWGLACAAMCYEGMRKWPEAERYYQTISNRYSDASLEWYYFCKRTGQGDLASASVLAARFVRDPRTRAEPRILFTIAVYHLLDNDPKKALDVFEKCYRRYPDSWDGFHVALIADQLGDTKKRDATLRKIRDKGGKIAISDTRKPREGLVALAALLLEDIQRGGKADFDQTRIEKIGSGIAKPKRTHFHYFLAVYLDLHGKPDEAIHYWKLSMASTSIGAISRTLSGAELLSRNYGPDSYLTVLPEADGQTKSEKQPDQK